MNFKLLLVALGMTITVPTYAQIFKLDFACTNVAACAVIGNDIRAKIKKVQDEINADLPSGETNRLMEGMANSSVMAGKGIGSDYASGMDVLMIGAGVGVGADLEKDEASDSDLSGVGVQGGLLIGTNLSWMDTQKILGLETNRLNVYFNFFKYDLEKSFDKSTVKADLLSWGVHASYLWKAGNTSKLLGWGGIRLHTGIERNSSEFGFTSAIDEPVEATSNGRTASGNLTGEPAASIKAATTSIPLEISTSVQLLYILSIYTGFGMDYNIGSAEGKGDLNSDPSIISCSGAAPCTTNPQIGTVTASADIDGKGKVNPFLTRGFAGLQINLPFTRIFVQVDKAFGNDLIGATTGLRFVF